jgi:phospholipase C
MRRTMWATLATLLVGLVPAAVSLAADPASTEPRTPIKHFVALMQQNRSFDHYFGTYARADGIPAGTCMPVNPARQGSRCVKPFHIERQPARGLPEGRSIFRQQLQGGRMNGFVQAVRAQSGRVDPSVMGYYDGRDIPNYWNAADQYVLFDRFFSSTPSGSVRNAMYWVSGTPGNYTGESIPAGGFGRIPTIFDRLEARGISWKFYVQNYDRGVNFRHRGTGERSAQVFWVPLLGYARYVDNPRLSRHIVDLNEYYDDLEHGTLPSVAYIVAPAGGASEQAPGTIKAGQQLVTKLINSLMRSSSWRSSAFMWTYDGWGGFYDHVRPPRVDRFGYGFRVPALLVSARARQGYVDSSTLDYASILKFIERNWNLKPLASRDRRARSFEQVFDFAKPPREPSFLSGQRVEELKKSPNRIAIYGAYIGALALTALILAWATLGWTPMSTWEATRRRRRRSR